MGNHNRMIKDTSQTIASVPEHMHQRSNIYVLHRHVCASPTCVASSSVELGSFGKANRWPKNVNLGATISLLIH